MKKVIMYSKPGCSFCNKAKVLLESMGIPYEERPVGQRYTKEDVVKHCTSVNSTAMVSSVPQMILWVDGKETYIGGYTDLAMKRSKL